MRAVRTRKPRLMRKLVRWLKNPENRVIIYLSILQGITCGAITHLLIALRAL